VQGQASVEQLQELLEQVPDLGVDVSDFSSKIRQVWALSLSCSSDRNCCCDVRCVLMPLRAGRAAVLRVQEPVAAADAALLRVRASGWMPRLFARVDAVLSTTQLVLCGVVLCV
jgi:hypothetical protein